MRLSWIGLAAALAACGTLTIGDGGSTGGAATSGAGTGGSTGDAECLPPCDVASYVPVCVGGQYSSCVASDPPCGGGRLLTGTCPGGCDAQGRFCAGGTTGGSTGSDCPGGACATTSGGGTSGGGSSSGGSTGLSCPETPCDSTFLPYCSAGTYYTCVSTLDPPCNGSWVSEASCPAGCNAAGTACATAGGTTGGGTSSGGSSGGSTGAPLCHDCFPPATSCCSGACSDPTTDPANCGGCGVTCASGVCAGGQCAATSCGVPCTPGSFTNSCANGELTTCESGIEAGCSGWFLHTGTCAAGCDSSGTVCAQPSGGGGGVATTCTADSDCCSAACVQGICACPVAGGCP